MPRVHFLKKVLKTNVTYEMEKDRYYVIRRLGTDSSARVTAKVDGVPVADFFNLVAPIMKSADNLLGPLDLKDYFVVVPPERKLVFESTASANVYVEGDLVVLSPGEAVPTEHLTRYNAYANRKVSYIDVTATVGASWPAGQEVKVVDVTPPTIEDHVFDGFAGCSVSNLSAAQALGQVNLKLYYDGVPLDLLVATAGPHGIETLKMPLPPRAAANEEPFTFEERPIAVVGGHTLTFTAINVSGGALSAAAGQSIAVRLVALFKRIIKA